MARRRRTDRDLRELRERKYRLRGGKAKTKRFIPDADREFAQMARLFADHIEAHADRFGFSGEKVEELTDAVAAFRDALARTMQRDHAGPMATATKNDARKKAEKIVRAAARYLRGVEEKLTSVDRMLLNIPERPKRVKRRVCPQVAPVLTFVGSTDPQGKTVHGARHILEYGNDFDRASSARPHGANRLELFVELVPIGEPIPLHPGERSGGRLWYLRSYTTSRFEVAFPVMMDGHAGGHAVGCGVPMLVCYWGRWADASGGVGPFSQTCVARVEGGAPGMTAHAQPGLPGAQREQVRVTQVVGQLESMVAVMPEYALPHLAEAVTA